VTPKQEFLELLFVQCDPVAVLKRFAAREHWYWGFYVAHAEVQLGHTGQAQRTMLETFEAGLLRRHDDDDDKTHEMRLGSAYAFWKSLVLADGVVDGFNPAFEKAILKRMMFHGFFNFRSALDQLHTRELLLTKSFPAATKSARRDLEHAEGGTPDALWWNAAVRLAVCLLYEGADEEASRLFRSAESSIHQIPQLLFRLTKRHLLAQVFAQIGEHSRASTLLEEADALPVPQYMIKAARRAVSDLPLVRSARGVPIPAI